MLAFWLWFGPATDAAPLLVRRQLPGKGLLVLIICACWGVNLPRAEDGHQGQQHAAAAAFGWGFGYSYGGWGVIPLL